eukprot:3728669-Alexandrium_andersonii.AAC.1
MDARGVGAVAKGQLAQRTAESRPCRGAVRGCGWALAAFTGLGLVRARGRHPRPTLGRRQHAAGLQLSPGL